MTIKRVRSADERQMDVFASVARAAYLFEKSLDPGPEARRAQLKQLVDRRGASVPEDEGVEAIITALCERRDALEANG